MNSYLICSWCCKLGEHQYCDTKDCNCYCHKQEFPYCCKKFQYLTQDIEVKGETIIINKYGKVTFVDTRACNIEEQTETKYPFYDFIKCPYCGKELQ